MERSSVFQGVVYSDPEYSEPETEDSDFDPTDLGDASDADSLKLSLSTRIMISMSTPPTPYHIRRLHLLG
jgi:hypothetical protein